MAVRGTAKLVRVTNNLPEVDGMTAGLDKFEQLLPELAVCDRVLLLVPPAVLSPRFVPAIPEAVHDVRRVRVEGHLSRSREGFQGFYRGPKLHPLIRCIRLRSR